MKLDVEKYSYEKHIFSRVNKFPKHLIKYFFTSNYNKHPLTFHDHLHLLRVAGILHEAAISKARKPTQKGAPEVPVFRTPILAVSKGVWAHLMGSENTQFRLCFWACFRSLKSHFSCRCLHPWTFSSFMKTGRTKVAEFRLVCSTWGHNIWLV